MQVDLDVALKDIEGAEIVEGQKPVLGEAGQPVLDNRGGPVLEGGTPITLGRVCVRALMANEEGDTAPGEEKLKRYDLARELQKGGTQSVKSEDVTMLKERIAKFFSTLVVGQTYHMLEGETE